VSARDYDRYHRFLSALKGRRSFVTVATNSIKVHIDKDKKGGIFLWLDPPWEFRKNGTFIETAATYPDHAEPDYERRFELWGNRFKPIFANTIEEVTASPEGSLLIKFEGGYEMFLPGDDSVQTDVWYDHWYFRDATRNIFRR
jgi:hypothetical protein